MVIKTSGRVIPTILGDFITKFGFPKLRILRTCRHDTSVFFFSRAIWRFLSPEHSHFLSWLCFCQAASVSSYGEESFLRPEVNIARDRRRLMASFFQTSICGLWLIYFAKLRNMASTHVTEFFTCTICPVLVKFKYQRFWLFLPPWAILVLCSFSTFWASESV